jgi:hypothetical protein
VAQSMLDGAGKSWVRAPGFRLAFLIENLG